MTINAKEINNIISDTLRRQLKDFSVNKANHIAQQKSGEKIHQIGWSVGNALNGFFYLHFWGGVRYTKIDDWYDSLFGQTSGFQSLLYCPFAEIGNTSNHGHFKVSNAQDIHDALAKAIAYINTELLPFFYTLKDENDFLNYLCDRKHFFSWSETFALKRIMLAALTTPDRVAEMHNFNLSLWQEDGKEVYSKRYWSGIDKLKSEIPELFL